VAERQRADGAGTATTRPPRLSTRSPVHWRRQDLHSIFLVVCSIWNKELPLRLPAWSRGPRQ